MWRAQTQGRMGRDGFRDSSLDPDHAQMDAGYCSGAQGMRYPLEVVPHTGQSVHAWGIPTPCCNPRKRAAQSAALLAFVIRYSVYKFHTGQSCTTKCENRK